MANLSWVGGAFPPALNVGAATVFGSIAGGENDGQSTEARASIHSAVGTYSLLNANVVANAGSATIRYRKNTSNGAQVLSTGAGGTGQFTDVTNSDAAVGTDLVDVSFVSTGSPTEYACFGLQFSATGNVTSYYGNGASTSGVQSVGCFAPFAFTLGTWGSNATEVNAQVKIRAPGTLSNLTTFETNGIQTFRTRINAANGNLVCTGAVGFQEDSTHTDTLSNGDLLDLSGGSSTGEITYQQSVRFVSSGSSHDLIASRSTGAAIASSPTFGFVRGITDGGAGVEASAQSRAPFGCKLSNLRAYVISAGGVATTLRSRIGGANGNQVVSITAATIGWFEDVTNSDVISSGALVCTSYTFATGSTPVSTAAMTLGPSLVTASGSVGTITLSAPTGGAVTSATPSGAIGTITLSAPAGHAALGAQVTVPKFLAQAAVAVADSIESPKMLAQAGTGIDDVIETPKQLAQAATGVTDATGGMVDGAIATPKIVAYAVLGPPPPRRPAQVRVRWSR